MITFWNVTLDRRQSFQNWVRLPHNIAEGKTTKTITILIKDFQIFKNFPIWSLDVRGEMTFLDVVCIDSEPYIWNVTSPPTSKEVPEITFLKMVFTKKWCKKSALKERQKKLFYIEMLQAFVLSILAIRITQFWKKDLLSSICELPEHHFTEIFILDSRLNSLPGKVNGMYKV